MNVDLNESELQDYRSSQLEPDDFENFWRHTIADARSCSSGVTISPIHTNLQTVTVSDVTFPGFDGEPIKAWLKTPRGAVGPLPTVVEFIGYGGGRGRPWENLFWTSAGFAHLMMDTRGQGSVWAVGQTPDLSSDGSPQGPGFMTRGVHSPSTYYYRRLITDAVRSVDAAQTLAVVDSERIAVIGRSQGGGVALAAAALSGRVRVVAAMVPFLCDFPRAVTVTDGYPYREIADYLAIHRDLVEPTLRTLSYFDAVNFAPRATMPAYFSAALMDRITPPSTIFGAYHRFLGPKEMQVWPHNGHESGGSDEDQLVLAFIKRHLDMP